MPAKVINFTKACLTNLPLPEAGKRKYYKDTQLKGLILDVRSNGSKSFYIYKKISGKPERLFLGIFPEITIENARKKAKIKIGEIAQGKNPQEEARQVRNEMSFEQLFDQYMKRYSKVHKKSWRYDEREVNRFLAHWFKRRLSDIKRVEVQRLHEKIYAESGLYQANRLLERIRAIFNKALEWGWEGTNPAIGIKKYKEKSRDRFIQPVEMPFIIRSLNEETNETVKDYLWILLLTGARKTNTLMMRWEQINWERNEWRIPDTKNGEPVTVPLIERALEILKRREMTSQSPWVFPQEADNEKHFVNTKRAWRRTLERATLYLWQQNERIAPLLEKLECNVPVFLLSEILFKAVIKRAEKEKIPLPASLLDIRLHDIRRTFGSYQALTGASLQVIGKSLGHKSTQATQIYARLNLDAVRASIEKATGAMFD
ncbi:recombinase XerD [Adhaeribacter arboris]|uniref:Recombinase XerD n=1 Tax=Adhaeribacter arboris TaxID=2072846 RepID=A0A2T2YJU1_9BACT|nr:site-specific integrase [Adhaeribacter arboris]PSR55777.1 recombinase XerD [Adhaeribacter arboris]